MSAVSLNDEKVLVSKTKPFIGFNTPKNEEFLMKPPPGGKQTTNLFIFDKL